MRALIAIIVLVPTVALAAPVPKGTKGSWVGKPAFVKGPNVQLTTVLANGTERKVTTTGVMSYIVTKVNDDRIEVLYSTGKLTAYFKKDDVMRASEAIEYYSGQLGTNPKDPFYLLARAEANTAEAKLDAAESDYTAVLAIEPNNTSYLMKRAAFRLTAKRFEKAIEDYDTLGNVEPSYKEWTMQRKAEAKAGMKKFDEAIADLTKVLETTQNRPSILLSRGLMYARAGMPEKAMADYDEIIKNDEMSSTGIIALNNKAWLKCTCPDAKFRDGKLAVEWATKACEMTQWKNAGHIDTLAAAYAEAGDFEKAVKYQTDVLADEALVRREGNELQERLELYKAKKAYRLPDETKKK